MPLPNYVKFQRGSLAAYNRLSQKDENTLYFVYESPSSSTGSLYLGDKLISNNVGGSGVSSLAELTDVIVTGANTGDFLVLNSEGKWTAVSAADVAAAIQTAGGSFIDIDTNQFQIIDGTGLSLKGYASATAGLVPVKGSTGLDWVSLPPDLSSDVGDLEAGLQAANTAIAAIQSDLSAVDSKIATAVAAANHLTYQVINDLNAVTAENVIYLHSSSTTSVNNIYEEYMLVNGNLEVIGSTNIDLSQYVTSTTFTALESRVSNLEPVVSNLVTTTESHTTAIAGLTTATAGLRTDLDNLILAASSGTYVLLTTFNAVIGDLTAVNGVMNNLQSDDSIAETLEDIYERLTWQEISE